MERLELVRRCRTAVGVDQDDGLAVALLGQLVDAIGLTDIARQVAMEVAARRGVQVTLLDPSGPLARLCAMPELAPFSRVLNLTGSERGTLAPYALIPTPQRGHYRPGSAGAPGVSLLRCGAAGTHARS